MSTARHSGWCTNHQDLGLGSGVHRTEVPFGTRPGGEPRAIEIHSYVGRGVLRTGTDPLNPWRNGVPQASVNVQDIGAAECRALAQALRRRPRLLRGRADGRGPR